MIKNLLIGISTATLLAATPALAQTTTTPTKSSTAVEKTKPAMEAEKNKSTAGGVARQPADDQAIQSFRASKLIGSTVVNAKNEAIGDINDLVIGSDGKVAKVIVGVGGFLGLGERNVALKLSALDLAMKNNGSIVVVTSLTKSQLEELPVWKKDSTQQ
jgi:sporulation protein YlmC with PRC-barrel domain